MKRAAIGVTTLAVVLELLAVGIFFWSRPQWAKGVLRVQYVWLWQAANTVTGEDLPLPDRFR
jgi:hypothetical protein